jgi:protein-S-isoprenylcysteine O-methyltransferase Ste14
MSERPPAVSMIARIPPPALFAVTFLAGVLVQRALNPHRIGPEVLGPIGAFMTVGGVLIALWAAGLFARNHTTIIPHGRSSTLVLRGPYRRSRNPMYVSLVLVYLGVALWTNAWVALGLVVLPIAVLGLVVVPMEESQLRERFGDSYIDYCRQVRRWL